MTASRRLSFLVGAAVQAVAQTYQRDKAATDESNRPYMRPSGPDIGSRRSIRPMAPKLSRQTATLAKVLAKSPPVEVAKLVALGAISAKLGPSAADLTRTVARGMYKRATGQATPVAADPELPEGSAQAASSGPAGRHGPQMQARPHDVNHDSREQKAPVPTDGAPDDGVDEVLTTPGAAALLDTDR